MIKSYHLSHCHAAYHVVMFREFRAVNIKKVCEVDTSCKRIQTFACVVRKYFDALRIHIVASLISIAPAVLEIEIATCNDLSIRLNRSQVVV